MLLTSPEVRYERARSMPDLDTLHRIVEACGFELRLELAVPDQQRAAAQRIAIEFPIDAGSLRRLEVSTWRTTHGDLDVVVGTPTATRGVLANCGELADRAATREAFGVTILVAALDDVVASKRALARESDLVALPELHRLRSRRP